MTTLEKIKKAVAEGRLKNLFTATDVNNCLKIKYAGTYLPKHRKKNPGQYKVFFNRTKNGYKLSK
jgi:hypothetical protein